MRRAALAALAWTLAAAAHAEAPETAAAAAAPKYRAGVHYAPLAAPDGAAGGRGPRRRRWSISSGTAVRTASRSSRI